MRKSGIVVLLLSVLLCCILSGCADFIKSEEMDKEVVNFIEALNEDDADRIFQSMYPDVVTREEFDESYEAVRKLWEKSDEYTTKLNSINTRKNYTQSGDFRICQAQYYVYTQAQDYTITFTYRSDDTGDGVYQFNLNVGAEPVLISGGFTTARENSAFQWGLLVFSVLSYLFIIATAVDILRKRPRLFGVWLAASLTFLAFWIQIVQIAPANIRVGGNVCWFVFSALKMYSTGGGRCVFAIPVGAIVYWCLRRKLLSQKLMTPKR